MDDLISRAALLYDLSYCAPELWQDEEYVKAKIMKQPAVDAIPVVRCRDCKYSDVIYETSYNMPLKCLNIRYGGVQPEWYCEHGERRDDDGKVD